MAPGHNGPYHDPETPVRNTSHWLITFLKALKITGDPVFREAGVRAASYLCSPEARPMRASFWHRKNPEKDLGNGLIGQAWTIEALALGGVALEMPELVDLGETVFLLHPFDQVNGLWRRVGVDGAFLSYDLTFNHQLWFAAAGALVAQHASGEVDCRVRRFMDRLGDNMGVFRSGLVRHPLRLETTWRASLKAMLKRGQQPRAIRRHLKHKAVGYHAFNLYGLAILAGPYPQHGAWRSEAFRKALRYMHSAEFVDGLEGNRYGYGYNVSGFEAAYALHVFGNKAGRDTSSGMRTWTGRQIERSYDLESRQMSRGTEDPLTHSARLYEATRLPDLAVEQHPSV